MRRLGAWLAALAGIALIVAAFFTVVRKSGGNIVTEGGNLPASLSGLDSWPGWLLLGTGVVILLSGLALLRYRSRLVALIMFVAGAAAAAVGIWALIDPRGFYVQVGALQVGEDADAISNILDQFEPRVSAGAGAWIAAIAGGVAGVLGLIFMVAPKPMGAEEAPPMSEPAPAPLIEEKEPIVPPSRDDATRTHASGESAPPAGDSDVTTDALGVDTSNEAGRREPPMPASDVPTSEETPPSPEAEEWR